MVTISVERTVFAMVAQQQIRLASHENMSHYIHHCVCICTRGLKVGGLDYDHL